MMQSKSTLFQHIDQVWVQIYVRSPGPAGRYERLPIICHIYEIVMTIVTKFCNKKSRFRTAMIEETVNTLRFAAVKSLKIVQNQDTDTFSAKFR